MKGNFSEMTVSETKYPKYWNCDICGGYFTIEDAGFISDEKGCADVCEECRGAGFDTSNGETVN